MFVFRNYTVENLFPEGTHFSGYDDISFIPKDENRLIWFYQVPIGFNNSSLAEEVEGLKNKLSLIAANLDSRQTLYVCSLINMFPISIVDSETHLQRAINGFNLFAQELSLSSPNIKYIDLNPYFSRFPSSDWINWRFYFISQMIVSPSVASSFPSWLEHRINQIEGQRKKCLVLDLDNTLWGGVLGEDGVDGIKVGGDYPGNAFLYFQEALISLSKTGVILTVCSKNNEEDVLEAWNSNPFIKLKKEFISAYRINWINKADNIRELASELNIGLDSMVFVDDNPTERELIRQQLPMVAVPDFPKKPYGLMEFFKSLVEEFFETPRLTSEDLNKTEQYRLNAQRAQAQRQFSDLSDFIKSLEIKVDIREADNFNIPRIAQMTQKTNQFNLTTHRYSEADIKNFVDNGHKVFCAGVSDKFGDNGITGAAIFKVEKDTAIIDSFLLSCRILGKGIENAILSALINVLFPEGIRKVIAHYIPTQKNAQVSDFYDKNGFTLIAEASDGSKEYELILNEKRKIDDSYTFTFN